MQRFTIGIAAYNEAASIGSLLDALRRLDPDQVDILVCDAGSSDSTVAVIKEHPILRQANVRFSSGSGEVDGPPGGWRLIADHVAGEHVVLTASGEEGRGRVVDGSTSKRFRSLLEGPSWPAAVVGALEEMRPIDVSRLFAVKERLCRAGRETGSAGNNEKQRLLQEMSSLIRFKVKRIVLLLRDMSDIGGVERRTQKTLRHAAGREVEYLAISLKGRSELRNHYSFETDAAAILEMMVQWQPFETVIVTIEFILRRFPKKMQRLAKKFPLIQFGSEQLSYFIQASRHLTISDVVENYRVAKIISLSQMDIDFQRQLGIHGQVLGPIPVEERSTNTYDIVKNSRIGYVGRITFSKKDSKRLLEIAACMKQAGLPPLRIYTTSGRNSPDFDAFMELLRASNAADHIEMILECTDHDTIYGDLAVLLLPSKMEPSGNVILEANSYGIPVIAASYAAGPARLVVHGETGFLLDEYSGEAVVRLLQSLTDKDRAALSVRAFEEHKKYGMRQYYERLEAIANETVNEFPGENRLRILPTLHCVEFQADKLRQAEARIRELEQDNRKIVRLPALRAFACRAKEMGSSAFAQMKRRFTLHGFQD